MTTPSLQRRIRSALFIALRAAFRAVPMSEARRDMLRSRFLRQFPTVRPLPAQGQVSATQERRPRVRADERCIGYVEYSEEPLPDPLPATLVAFYLPQFHTIPENDEWWGKGFTEWRNVTRALPQFEGHLQPRLPGDLGFYDLRNPQVMRDQAKLAKTYGLSAFCFYFYWFGGKTLLEEPVRNWLNDKSIDFQYCLCWANENWTRRWDGRDDEVLIAQKHSPDDDIAFIAHVADYLRDPRYLRVDGKPMLLLYRPMLLPDPTATAERWRAWCRENGVGEIHLAYVQSFERPDPRDIGFDAAVEFPPNLVSARDVTAEQVLFNPEYRGQILDWRDVVEASLTRPLPDYTLYRGVNCGWDNAGRRLGAGQTFVGLSFSQYENWLKHVLAGSGNRRIAFINAWNEWAEGAILEPDCAWGYARLEATRHAQLSLAPANASAPQLCVVIHAFHLPEFEEIAEILNASKLPYHAVITTCYDREMQVRISCERLMSSYEIHAFENRGRDILPFVQVGRRLLARGTDLVLKLHTKRSPQLRDGGEWRRRLVRELVPGIESATIYRQLQRRTRIGVAAPSWSIVPVIDHGRGNDRDLENVCRRVGIAQSRIDGASFPAGSMFWVRLSAIDGLLSAAIFPSDFAIEDGQLDGTMAHAVERLLIAVVEAAGFDIATCDDLVKSSETDGPRESSSD